MAMYAFDSSALATYYHQEDGSAAVIRLVQDPSARHDISRLTFLEMHAVFAGKVRTSVISHDALILLRTQFRNDVYQGRFRVFRLTPQHYNEAERLLMQYGTDQGLRTLDALQLAVALDLHRRNLLDHFVCADAILCRVTLAEGISTFNPVQP
jgi:predicted nucleic acid-binding protein